MDIFYKKIKANVTPEVLAQLHSKKIILESTNQQQTKGRYSVVIFDIYGTLTLDNDVLSVSTLKESYQIIERPYHYLTTKINEDYHNIQDEQLKSLPFISGYVGTCSFDLVRHEFPKLQSIQLEDHKQHDVRLYMVEQVYVFDHYKDELYIIATNQFSNSTKSDLENRVNKSIEDLTKIQPFMPTQDFDFKTKEIQSNISEERFIEMIQYFKEKITEGDMFQVVPSRIYKYAHHASQHLNQLSFQLYQNLKRQNPSPYMYYLNIDQPYIVGSSPESFVSVKDQIVTTNPIAGTIQRGETTQIDNENMKQLLNDPKECSEHRMLVDLGRNDIHRVSKIGTSKITKLMVIEKYEHVMHIVSEITGKINQNLSPMTVIANLLPTGTVSGAPKLRAIERIYEQYPHKRGVYSGGVGYINCNHNLDFALAIRTMMIDEQYINVEAGCGVVYDSFTYNLVDIVAQHTDVIVQYPDDDNVLNQSVDAVIISPGPGHPLDDQQLMKIISTYQHKPILGICLGAQALTCYYGGEVIKGDKVMHEKVDTLKVISHHQHLLYQDIPEQFSIMRYHSLISNPDNFPEELKITGRTEDCIQSFEHKERPHYGIQYHPESFATDYGVKIITNFINLVKEG
ncbi:TPA: anthranilate synthase component I [Staphylococcus aureus]|nr:anthranilate synthase component I [Staphylococcus aureus]